MDDECITCEGDAPERAAEVQEGMRVLRRPQHALSRRRRLRTGRVVQETPLVAVVEVLEAVHESRTADAGPIEAYLGHRHLGETRGQSKATAA
ncbi:hypothetical protein A9R05_27930 [Burkholderia sp. KK1]|nr:hypothetical protein A9R05_27930 [Burkholderia sp. KK1]